MAVLEERQTGEGCEVIDRAHGASVTAGTPVFIAGIGAAVPQVSAASGVNVAYRIKGRYRATITTAVTVAQGDALYYDSAAGTVQKTVPAAGFFIGVAAEAGTAAGGYVDVLLNASPASMVQDGFERLNPATVTTAGNATQTAAQFVGGLILRDPAGADRTDTTPTAALIVAAISGVVADGAIRVIIENTADAEEDITLAAGLGVTFDPTSIVIRRGERRELLVRVTNATASSEAVTIYDLTYRPATSRTTTRQTTETNGGDTAYSVTAAAVVGGFIYGAVGAARNYTLPTATAIAALLPNVRIGDTIEFVVCNNAAGANAITVVCDASITNRGLATHLVVSQNTRSRFWLRFTAADAADLLPA